MFILINHSVQPIYRLIRRMSKTKDGQLDLTSKIEESGSYEIKELSHVYNILLDDINRYINQLVEEQSNRRKAEIHALQMQINPHFIYNTLTTIKWLIWPGRNGKICQNPLMHLLCLQEYDYATKMKLFLLQRKQKI